MPLKSNLFRVSATASACGQRSVVHSLPQLVVVWSYCRWREEAVEKMFDIVIYENLYSPHNSDSSSDKIDTKYISC